MISFILGEVIRSFSNDFFYFEHYLAILDSGQFIIKPRVFEFVQNNFLLAKLIHCHNNPAFVCFFNDNICITRQISNECFLCIRNNNFALQFSLVRVGTRFKAAHVLPRRLSLLTVGFLLFLLLFRTRGSSSSG